ncbi:MAG: hypothetical protein ACFBRM_13045 [Pikeienuella sp.]
MDVVTLSLSGAFLLISTGSLLWLARMPRGDKRRLPLLLVNLPWLAVAVSMVHLAIPGCEIFGAGAECDLGGVALGWLLMEFYWVGWLTIIFITTPAIVVMALAALFSRTKLDAAAGSGE